MLGCPTIDPATAPARMEIARMKPAAWVDRVRWDMERLWQEGIADSIPPLHLQGGISGESPVKHHPARFRNPARLEAPKPEPGERLLQQTAFAPAAFTEAAKLIERFGEYAGSEAALRADRSRDLGNFVHFCRWREVGRMIELIRDEAVTGPVH